jgi:flagellar protein FlbD
MTLNAEWILSVEQTPDTMITLTTGVKIIVQEKVEEVVAAFEEYKKKIFSKDYLKEN